MKYRKSEKYKRNKLYRSISVGINNSLRKYGKSKNGLSWTNLVNFTLEELRCHIEGLFVDGMSWDNHGVWHIDHKRPIASFGEFSQDNWSECWCLSNLQPLWSWDNISKGAKYKGKDFRYEVQEIHSGEGVTEGG